MRVCWSLTHCVSAASEGPTCQLQQGSEPRSFATKQLLRVAMHRQSVCSDTTGKKVQVIVQCHLPTARGVPLNISEDGPEDVLQSRFSA